MNRIYKLVLVVEVSARSSFVLSMSVQINVITDINIFVQALTTPQYLGQLIGFSAGVSLRYPSRSLDRCIALPLALSLRIMFISPQPDPHGYRPGGIRDKSARHESTLQSHLQSPSVERQSQAAR